MTVISALITQKGTTISTDSLLTVRFNNKSHHIEWSKSKIVRLEKFRGSVSYWGCAGLLKSYNKKTKKSNWFWNIESWLSSFCKNPVEDNIEDFVENLKNKLHEELKKWFSNIPGIGIHITCYEYINDFWIPELFLVTNYSNTDYNKIGDLSYSRHTYHTINHKPPYRIHKRSTYRLEVKDFLLRGGVISYNNGDPILYNPITSAIFEGIKTAKNRKVLKEFKSYKDYIPLICIPIEVISKLQNNIYMKDKKLVGGKVHNLAISPNGEYFSTSRD